MNTYKYRPLSHHRDAIRLLSLSPSIDEAGDLCGELIHTRLSECDIYGYTALSYAWGGKHQASIKVEGCNFPIGNNLSVALHDLRKKHKSVLLFIDALCINQNDTGEKNRQVHCMTDIFSTAEETVIYLGEDDRSNTTHSAWNFMERHSTWAMNSNGDRDFELPSAREDEVHFRGNLEDVEIAILSRAIFRRCWILSEVIISRTLSVQCGRYRKISWDDFVKTILQTPHQQSQYRRESQSWATKIDIIKYMNHTRSMYQKFQNPLERPGQSSQSKLNILDLLARSRSLEAFDPRDKVFAFAGISLDDNVNGQVFAIDYANSCAEVYTGFTKWFLEFYKSYDILSYAEKGLNYHEIELFGKAEFVYSFVGSDKKPVKIQLSSWTPNWGRSEASHRPRFMAIPRNQDGLARRSPISGVMERARRGEGRLLSYKPPRLTILGPANESAYHTSMRQSLVLENHGFSADTQSLACNGSILGTIDVLGPRLLTGVEEKTKFQSICDRHSVDEKKRLYDEIMQEWQTIFEGQGRYDFEPDAPVPTKLKQEKALAFASSFSSIRQSDFPTGNSIEHHLFSRARKSGSSTADGNIAAPMLDLEESIIDGRRLAIYVKSSLDPDKALERSLVLLPEGAQPGDFIAYFTGARVAFVVREVEDPPEVSAASIHAEFKLSVDEESEIVCCELIGECLVNDLPDILVDALDETWEVVDRPRASCVFVVS